jgi:GT2 family glycosyltransferase
MEFAVLLPVYNHLDYTQLTLRELSIHLAEQPDASFHIVLIDDGSTDGTSQWVKSNYPDVTILSGDGNLWWSGAINMGARHAIESMHVDYLILWNNDIQIDTNYFSNLVKIVSELDDPTVIGSKVYVAEQKDMVWSMGGYFHPRSGKYDMYGFFKKDSEEYSSVCEADWLTGMGTIVPKEVVERIGYWDDVNFPQYHGDGDFTYRAKLAGYKILVYPSLKMYNHVGNSGVTHEGSFKKLIRLLTDIRSKTNLKKNLKFYRLYAKSPRAYLPLVWLYIQIFGGFFKWKLLNFIGFKKKSTL